MYIAFCKSIPLLLRRLQMRTGMSLYQRKKWFVAKKRLQPFSREWDFCDVDTNG